MSDMTLGAINKQAEAKQHAREFVQIARFLALGKGSAAKAAKLAEEAGILGGGPRVPHVLKGCVGALSRRDLQHRAAVDPGTISGWGSSLSVFESTSNAFLTSLAPLSIFDALWEGGMLRLPLRSRIAATTVAIAGAAGTAEASVKTISRMTLTSADLEATKATAIIVLAEELLKHGGQGTAFFEIELRRAISRATNSIFLPLLVAGSSFASSGATALGARQDIRTLLSAVNSGADARLYLIVSRTIAEAWASMGDSAGGPAFPQATVQGGSIGGIQILVCDEATSGEIILVDATAVAAGQEGMLLDSSDQTSIQLDSAPDSPITASTNLVSMWHTNSVALRAERYIGAKLLRSDATARITSANYTGNSPA